jgi:hypothetical protein
VAFGVERRPFIVPTPVVPVGERDFAALAQTPGQRPGRGGLPIWVQWRLENLARALARGGEAPVAAQGPGKRRRGRNQVPPGQHGGQFGLGGGDVVELVQEDVLGPQAGGPVPPQRALDLGLGQDQRFGFGGRLLHKGDVIAAGQQGHLRAVHGQAIEGEVAAHGEKSGAHRAEAAEQDVVPVPAACPQAAAHRPHRRPGEFFQLGQLGQHGLLRDGLLHGLGGDGSRRSFRGTRESRPDQCQRGQPRQPGPGQSPNARGSAVLAAGADQQTRKKRHRAEHLAGMRAAVEGDVARAGRAVGGGRQKARATSSRCPGCRVSQVVPQRITRPGRVSSWPGAALWRLQ